MDINELLSGGGILTMEGFKENGKRCLKTSYLGHVVRPEDGETEFVKLGTIYSSTIRKALKYMPEMLNRYSFDNGYRGFEIDLTNAEDEEVSGWGLFNELLKFGCDAMFSADKDYKGIRVQLNSDNVPKDSKESGIGYGLELVSCDVENAISSVVDEYYYSNSTAEEIVNS